MIQGLKYFDVSGPTEIEQLVAVREGTYFSWDGSAWTEMVGFFTEDVNVRVAMAQGVDKLLVCDGTTPMIWDGTEWSTASGSDTNDVPKTTTILLWHAGRMWAAGFPGDVEGLEDDALWGSALLSFGPGGWDKTKRNFRVGGGEGDPIVGLATLDKFTLAVMKRNSIHLITTPPNTDFTNFTDDLAPEVLSYGAGLVSKRGFCKSGNDLLYVANDRNIRSLQRMQAAAGQYQLSAPLSQPLQPYIDRINWNFAHTICAQSYREYALFAVPLDAATYPTAVLVWNSRLQRWIGIWTGWTPQDWEVTRFGGVQRLVFGDFPGDVKQWKDWKDQGDDATYKDDENPIFSKFSSRSMLFGEPLNEKASHHSEFRFGSSNATVQMGLVADNADLFSWTGNLTQQGPDLPLDLPFDLVNPTNRPIRRGLRGLRRFNEVYATIESTEGWWALRNGSLAAHLKTIKRK